MLKVACVKWQWARFRTLGGAKASTKVKLAWWVKWAWVVRIA